MICFEPLSSSHQIANYSLRKFMNVGTINWNIAVWPLKSIDCCTVWIVIQTMSEDLDIWVGGWSPYKFQCLVLLELLCEKRSKGDKIDFFLQVRICLSVCCLFWKSPLLEIPLRQSVDEYWCWRRKGRFANQIWAWFHWRYHR